MPARAFYWRAVSALFLRAVPALAAFGVLVAAAGQASAQVQAEFNDEYDQPPAGNLPAATPPASTPEPIAAPPAVAPINVQSATPAPVVQPQPIAPAPAAPAPAPAPVAPAPAPAPVAAPLPVPAPAPQAGPMGASAMPATSASTSAGVDFERASASTSVNGSEWPAETREGQQLRVSNTWFGPSGGVHVVDAGSGLPGTFRLQLGVDFFSSGDFLIEGDADDYAGGTLSLSWTPVEHLELFGALENHANSNDKDEPQLMQVLGDSVLGIKGYADALPWLNLGGDARITILNTVGDVGPVLDALGLGLRANASADLRQLEEPVPLLLRFGLDYLLDNSSNLIENLEADRYQALGTRRAPIDSEVRHLLRRVERFSLGINRVDMLTIALGLEAPLRVAPTWFVHPLLEWSFGIPVNRQGYSCLLVPTNAGPGDSDGCLDIEGAAAMPSTLTLGVRLHPPVNGLSFLAALDIGLSGTSTFVRELAANRPYAMLLALSYAVDARERKPEAGKVQLLRVPAPLPPPKPRVHGVVVDAMSGAPIAAAAVHYPIAALNPQLTDAAGQFTSYELEPGPLSLDISATDYDPRTCSVDVPAPPPVDPNAPTPTALAAQPAPAPANNAPVPLGSPRPSNEPPELNPYFGLPRTTPVAASVTVVELRCELTPRPRIGALRGHIVAPDGAPVVGASAKLIGATTIEMTSDSQGEVGNAAVPAGSYQLRVEAEGYLLRQLSLQIEAAQTTNAEVALVPKPKEAQVELTKEEVRIRKQIFFKSNSAEISEKSDDLLSEIADVLLRNPEVTLVEIQGHTDNRGGSELNKTLSGLRAEAVRTWLVGHGIEASRLTANGYGDARPLVPNITERNRARNRRVQFIIKEPAPK